MRAPARTGGRRPPSALAAVVAVMLAAAGCTGPRIQQQPAPSTSAHPGPLRVAAIWTGEEEEAFRAVLREFTRTSGVPAEYWSTGDDVPAAIDAAVAADRPPDVAVLPQPGLLRSLAVRRLLRPAAPAVAHAVQREHAPLWRELGTSGGTLYGVFFKASNKSTWWYDPRVLRRAGVTPPATLGQLQAAQARLARSGLTPLAVGAADGWPLTDLFENVLLQTAGAGTYDALASNELAWTAPPIVAALAATATIATRGQDAARRTAALGTDFPASVSDVFGPTPTAATVFEGDFVTAVIRKVARGRVSGRDFDFFPFPSVGAGPTVPTRVVAGGDVAVAMSDDPRAQRLLEFLAAPEAARPWARRGGFISPNRALEPSAYPDALTRRAAAAVTDAAAAGSLRFDLSDLQPPAFGATPGAGLYRHLQTLLSDPRQAVDVARALEADAQAARRSF